MSLIPSLNAYIFQLDNGDLYFSLYSADQQEAFVNTCAANVTSSASHFYITSSAIGQYTNYTMFSVEDYSVLLNGELEESSPNTKLARVGLSEGEGTSQPMNFILRIFNDSSVFRGPFTIKGGNSGLVFTNQVFIFSEDYQFFPPEHSSTETISVWGILGIIVICYFLFSRRSA